MPILFQSLRRNLRFGLVRFEKEGQYFVKMSWNLGKNLKKFWFVVRYEGETLHFIKMSLKKNLKKVWIVAKYEGETL